MIVTKKTAPAPQESPAGLVVDLSMDEVDFIIAGLKMLHNRTSQDIYPPLDAGMETCRKISDMCYALKY